MDWKTQSKGNVNNFQIDKRQCNTKQKFNRGTLVVCICVCKLEPLF